MKRLKASIIFKTGVTGLQAPSFSRANSPCVELVVLIVVVLVAIVGIEVPRVVWIGRVLTTRPVHIDYRIARLLSGYYKD